MSYDDWYEEEIENEYLGLTKLLRARTYEELQIKISNQESIWDKKEEAQRARDKISDLKEQAIELTEDALATIDEFNNILKATIEVDDKLNWNTLFKRESFRKHFNFTENPPILLKHEPILSLNDFAVAHKVPSKSAFEILLPFLKTKRMETETRIKELYESEIKKFNEKSELLLRQYNEEIEQYEKRKKTALELFDKEKNEFMEAQKQYNDSIHKFRNDFETNEVGAIERYLRLVLEYSRYPEIINKDFEISYEPISKTAIISYWLPNIDIIPKTTGYKFVQSRKALEEIFMKQKDFDTFYESIIMQITLRTIHEVYESVYTNSVDSVVFNGWVKGIDKATGNEFTSCIISCQASKTLFESFNLANVSPKECIRSLKGLVAGPLATMAPVKPILDINRDDKRFIESKEILAGINSTDNLATMDWEDFEHLVRELFSKLFSREDSEVRVTQASRDGGVDAIAFDPDPIRGGKFVIQAKRYNNVVPVSAVRDLYGTMINEGAVKGILVTTSYYGNDSREFAKDKPITLIDGSNLVHLFQEHGHNVRIELQKKQ